MTTTMSGAEQATMVISEEILRRSITRDDVRLADCADGAAERDARRQAAAHDLEPRPGGRWYRDLGGDNGHLWGFVQSIKRPSLLEIWGPLFVSTGATSHPIFRLSESGRRYAHHIPPFARRSGARRLPPAHGTRLVGSSSARQESRRGGIPIRRPS